MGKQGIEHQILSLEILPEKIAFTELFGRRTSEFQKIIDDYILTSEKLVFISPEYNGSYPGILKIFLDSIHPDINRGKKVALIGVSSGRAGNLRGMEHLTGVLNYLGMFVHPNKQPISSIGNLLNENGIVIDEITLAVLKKHISDFVNW